MVGGYQHFLMTTENKQAYSKCHAQSTNSVFHLETQENKIKRENIQIEKLNLTRLEKPKLCYVLVALQSNN